MRIPISKSIRRLTTRLGLTALLSGTVGSAPALAAQGQLFDPDLLASSTLFNTTGQASYSAQTDQLRACNSFGILGGESLLLEITAQIDENGNLTAPAELIIAPLLAGPGTPGGCATLDTNNVRVSASLSSFGWVDGVSDDFQFTGKVIGADAATGFVAGDVIGVDMNLENSTFNGDWGVDHFFAQPVKTFIGGLPPARLGDYLWEDFNRDGQQNEPPEAGINDQPVHLLDCGLNVVATTTTKDDQSGEPGYYLFDDLAPGCYIVSFTAPTGSEFTQKNAPGVDPAEDSDAEPGTGQTAPVVVGPGDEILTIDAGVFRPDVPLLGDFVFEDTNANGRQDPNEPGINNASVALLDCDGNPIATTTTSSDADGNPGYYMFDFADGVMLDVCYKVSFTAPTDYCLGAEFTERQAAIAGAELDSDAPLTDPVTLTAPNNLEDLTLDAGILCPASLGDYVWDDLDRNGVQDDGETGVNGVLVELLGCADETVIASTTTSAGGPNDQSADPDGYYAFTGLTPGCYRVQFTAPDGFVFTQPNQGTDDALDSDADSGSGRTADVNLASGEDNPTVDAGLHLSIEPKIGDFVWEDKNNNGRQDPNEPGIPEASVELLDCADNLIAATTTSSTGEYLFDGSDGIEVGGCYRVRFPTPEDYCIGAEPTTFQAAGIDSGLNSDAPKSGNIDISAPDALVDLTIDGGFICSAGLGDYVWEDVNGDGIQNEDPESGINGVDVTLLSPGADGVCNTGDETLAITGSTPNPTQTADDTDGNPGYYAFFPLEPGDYCVRITRPDGFECTAPNQGPGQPSPVDSDVDPNGPLAGACQSKDAAEDPISLASGEFDKTWDAGIYRPASLGDRVWVDRNGNGLQDPGESGLPNVEITLDGNDGSKRTTTTDGNGEYLFPDLVPGVVYTATCVIPDGYQATAPVDQTPQTEGDNNATADGGMGSYTLASGDSDLTIDCGLVEPASLGDKVWLDEDGDGQQGATEPGVPDVTITLTGDDGSNRTTTTDGNGEYLFEDLTPGVAYIATCVIPAGFNATTPAVQTPQTEGDNNAETDGGMGSYVLASGESELSVDCGLIELPSTDSVCIPSIDFDLGSLGAGDIVSDQFTGVTINAVGSTVGGTANVAMIFDSSNPTGGDSDLGTPNQRFGGPGIGSGGASNRRPLGNVLIISEDLDSSDPDDDGQGGTIVFDFDAPTRVSQVEILDIDRGEIFGEIVAFDAAGNEIASADILDAGNNSYQIVELNAEKVSRLEVFFPSSGAVAGLGICPGIDIRKQAEGFDSRTFAPGEEVIFEIEVTNSGEDPLTGVKVTDELLPGCDRHIGDLAVDDSFLYTCTGTAGGGIESQTFADHFNVRGYGNNDGTGQWKGDWVEFDKANPAGAGVQDPLNGNVLVGSNHKIWLDDAPNTHTEPSIQRAVDLAGAISATLAFDWTVHTGVDKEDAVTLDISSDGGRTWSVLKVFTGFTGQQINHRTQHESFDIKGFASAHTVIRWRVTNMYGGRSETFKVDNVVIAAEGAGSDGYVNEACVTGFGGGIEVSDCDQSEVKVDDDTPPAGNPAIDIRKQEEGEDQRTFAPGDTVPFLIEVENTGDVALSNVIVTDPLLPDCGFNVVTLAAGDTATNECETVLEDTGATRTFADDFYPQRFDGNDGDTHWSTDWIEYDLGNANHVSQDPRSGRIVVGGNHKLWLNDLYDVHDEHRGQEPYVMRTANLTGATSAKLHFGWTVHCGVDPSDEISLDLSADGGSTWTTVKTFTGFYGSHYCGKGDVSESLDISAFISDETTVRWRVSNLYGGQDEMFKVDNVKIVAEGSGVEGFINEARVSADAPDGQVVTDSDTSEVVVEGAAGPEPTHIMLEAEQGERSSHSKWLKKRDGGASGGRYLTPADGYNFYDEPSTSSRKRVSWTFQIDQAGDYGFWGRVIAPSGNDDSMWVRVRGNGMDTGWIKWNQIAQGHNWHWDQVHDNDNHNALVELALQPGDYELIVSVREDGVKLDAWKITSDPSYDPNYD